MKYIPVAHYEQSKIYTSTDSFISFSNSPYPAHRLGYGLDIYNASRSYFADVFSPVDGKFVFTKRIGEDCVSAIQVRDNLIVRILHLDPAVDIGSYIYVGDYIGNYIRSPFFEFWTDPHIHVEYRKSLKGILRSSGGLPLHILFDADKSKINFSKRFSIISKRPEYLLVSIPEPYVASFGPYFGLKVQLKNGYGLLEGGIPYYGYGRVYSEYLQDSKLKLFDKEIGSSQISYNVGFIDFRKQIKITANEISIRGIALNLYLSKPAIKIVPYNTENITDFRIGESIKFDISLPNL